jgi:hypothetical protein
MATAQKPQQPGNEILITTCVQLIGVGLFGVMAGMSDGMGTVMVVMMWGFVLGWLLLNTTQLGNLVKDI